jgi:hypothetical protein
MVRSVLRRMCTGVMNDSNMFGAELVARLLAEANMILISKLPGLAVDAGWFKVSSVTAIWGETSDREKILYQENEGLATVICHNISAPDGIDTRRALSQKLWYTQQVWRKIDGNLRVHCVLRFPSTKQNWCSGGYYTDSLAVLADLPPYDLTTSTTCFFVHTSCHHNRHESKVDFKPMKTALHSVLWAHNNAHGNLHNGTIMYWREHTAVPIDLFSNHGKLDESNIVAYIKQRIRAYTRHMNYDNRIQKRDEKNISKERQLSEKKLDAIRKELNSVSSTKPNQYVTSSDSEQRKKAVVVIEGTRLFGRTPLSSDTVANLQRIYKELGPNDVSLLLEFLTLYDKSSLYIVQTKLDPNTSVHYYTQKTDGTDNLAVNPYDYVD